MSPRRIRGRRIGGRLATLACCAVAGALLSSSATVSGGIDLRPNRNTDLVSLVTSAKAQNDKEAGVVAQLRDEVDTLTKQQVPAQDSSDRINLLVDATGGTAVKGPGVQVTLNDAPTEVKPAGVDPDLLVVHQQDIQSVLNVLWAGGAEAVTVQGQRIGATTGIKCVGNTVIIRGVPYAPPYRIAAIGDPDQLEAALASSSYIKAYQKFVDAYGLGYGEQRMTELTMPAYQAPQQLTHAKPQR